MLRDVGSEGELRNRSIDQPPRKLPICVGAGRSVSDSSITPSYRPLTTNATCAAHNPGSAPRPQRRDDVHDGAVSESPPGLYRQIARADRRPWSKAAQQPGQRLHCDGVADTQPITMHQAVISLRRADPRTHLGVNDPRLREGQPGRRMVDAPVPRSQYVVMRRGHFAANQAGSRGSGRPIHGSPRRREVTSSASA